MAVNTLTATKITKHKPLKEQELLSDGNGLFLRFRRCQAGQYSRTWLIAYEHNAKSRYLTLGEYEALVPEVEATVYRLPPSSRLTLETVRRIAIEIKSWRRARSDPKAFLQSEKDRLAAEAQAMADAEALRKNQLENENRTVADLYDAWLKDGVRRADGNAELERSLKRDVLPSIGSKRVVELSEHDLRNVLRSVAKRGANRAATILRNDLMQMFTWAEKRQPWRKLMVDGNPMDLIEIKKIVASDYDMNNVRERFLSANELRELKQIFDRMQAEYDASPDKRFGPQPVEKTTQHALWIMLSTLCRVGELSKARWEHVDFDAHTWFIPKTNVKGKVSDFTVYLSDFALEHFQSLHKLTGKTDWCFPSKLSDIHISEKSISKQVGDRQSVFKKNREGQPRRPMKNRRHDNTLVLSGGKKGGWTPHDLRRTGATLMQSLGVTPDIIDRCQNHVLAGGKVRRHYLHHDYAEETKEAWRLFGNRLFIIFEPKSLPASDEA